MENITITEFAENIKNRIFALTDFDGTIDVKTVLKNNGVSLIGLVIKASDSNIAPTIYMEPFFDEYINEKQEDEIAHEVYELYQRNAKPAFDVSFFEDYAQIKTKLSVKLLNRKANLERLVTDKIVSRTIGSDLAEVPIVVLHDESFGSGCITITYDHLHRWNISEKELWQDVDNALQTEEYVIRPLAEYLEEQGFPSELLSEMPATIVTNTSNTYGAYAALNTKIMNDLCAQANVDRLVVIPSSIHECIVMPDRTECMMFGQMIKEVNASCLSPEEVLSDHAYFWDRNLEPTLYDYEEECA